MLGPILFLLYTLGDAIDRHNMSHSEFADYTQLYDFALSMFLPWSVGFKPTCLMLRTSVKDWMTENKLQLNDGKTEALIISSQKSSSLPQSIQVGQDEIKFVESVRNLNVIFDSKLSMKDQVNKICQLAFLKLRTIGSIRHLLPVKATHS